MLRTATRCTCSTSWRATAALACMDSRLVARYRLDSVHTVAAAGTRAEVFGASQAGTPPFGPLTANLACVQLGLPLVTPWASDRRITSLPPGKTSASASRPVIVEQASLEASELRDFYQAAHLFRR